MKFQYAFVCLCASGLLLTAYTQYRLKNFAACYLTFVIIVMFFYLYRLQRYYMKEQMRDMKRIEMYQEHIRVLEGKLDKDIEKEIKCTSSKE